MSAAEDRRSPADQVDALDRAALELDPPAAAEVITAALRTRGVVAAWTDVLAPALRRRGEHYERTADGIAAEHLLSECLRAALSAVIWRRRRWTLHPPVLLAAPDGEQHVLPLHALAAALAEDHRHSTLLGASVPSRALRDAADRLDPTVIFLWAHSPVTAKRADVTGLRRHRHLDASTLVLGGPGWRPDAAGLVDDLAAAVRACTAPDLPPRDRSRRRPARSATAPTGA